MSRIDGTVITNVEKLPKITAPIDGIVQSKDEDDEPEEEQREDDMYQYDCSF